MTYARVVIVLHLYLLEQCLDPVLRTLVKTCNFVTFYEFLIHVGMHHTSFWLDDVIMMSPALLTDAVLASLELLAIVVGVALIGLGGV
jgi:hypothetical protein